MYVLFAHIFFVHEFIGTCVCRHSIDMTNNMTICMYICIYVRIHTYLYYVCILCANGFWYICKNMRLQPVSIMTINKH